MTDRPTREEVDECMRMAREEEFGADDPSVYMRVLADEVLALREELEVDRMRLAACGAAAHGGGPEHFANMRPEYDSDALRATRALRAILARVEALLTAWAERPYRRAYHCRLDLKRTLRGEP